ncbi:YraN family protein [Patescibacteria group bacterium]|nr:YraN family protein [Patescibacteria group bacterium]
MTTSKRKFGDKGEEIACRFLKSDGYKILLTNYQKQIGEIDIIAKKNNSLHFIEVKTRSIKSTEKYGLPQEAVNFYKRKKLIRTALFYLSENNFIKDELWQIDVISIILDKEHNKAKINHIKNAVNYDNL